MTLDRKDYKSAIPQLESRLEQIEKLGKDVFNKFEDIAHQTQLDAAEAEKEIGALDAQMNTLKVVTEYAIVPTGYDPDDWSGTTWDTVMPNLDADSFAPTVQYPNGFTLWARSKTYRNDIVVRYTDPQPVELMDGVFTFVNTVASDAGWTTINGDTITTGKITSADGKCYFDLSESEFQLKDGTTLGNSDNALAWDGDNGTLYLKGELELVKDGFSYLKATSGTLRVGREGSGYSRVLLDPDGTYAFDIIAKNGTHAFTTQFANGINFRTFVTKSVSYNVVGAINTISSTEKSNSGTATISQLSSVQTGEQFYLNFYLAITADGDAEDWGSYPFVFTKGTSKTRSYTGTEFTIDADDAVNFTITVAYNGSTGITVTTKAKHSGDTYDITYNITKTAIDEVGYTEKGILRPIHKLNGDVHLNSDGSGNTFIGINADSEGLIGDDAYLMSSINALGWQYSNHDTYVLADNGRLFYLKKMLANLMDMITVKKLSPTYTRTAGATGVTVSARRCGNVVHIYIIVPRTYEVTGTYGNLAEGYLDNIPMPSRPVKFAAYNAEVVGILNISTDGSVICRVNSAISTANSSFIFGGTYLTDMSEE